MDEKYVKVDDIVEYCNTYSVYLQGKGQGVAQCALRYVKEFAKENATDVQPVKHGRWITKSDVFYIAWQESGRRWEDMPYFATGLNFACSNCFEKFDVNAEGVEKWNGCPLCLARMDGDAE